MQVESNTVVEIQWEWPRIVDNWGTICNWVSFVEDANLEVIMTGIMSRNLKDKSKEKSFWVEENMKVPD